VAHSLSTQAAPKLYTDNSLKYHFCSHSGCGNPTLMSRAGFGACNAMCPLARESSRSDSGGNDESSNYLRYDCIVIDCLRIGGRCA
jgi:hypothetical protein